MLTPLPLGLGLRYVRARQHQFFVSFISWVSLLGVCLGVAALIAILSVMNGFETETRTRLLSLTAHATVAARAEESSLVALAGRARSAPGVVAARPYVEIQGLLSNGSLLAGSVLRGIRPADYGAETALRRGMREGRLDALVPGSRRIVLGRVLAAQLRAETGDTVNFLLLRTGDAGELAPRIAAFEVAGIFEVGLADHDSAMAFATIEDVVALAGAAAPAGVQLYFADPFAAPRLTPGIASALGVAKHSDWSTEHAAFFRAIRIEKTMMAVLLLLIVSVAAFNIVASLVMVVNEKRNDIAILRTLGLSRAGIVATFLTQGTVIGWGGTAAGVALGVLLALNAAGVVAAVERLFGFRMFDPDVYYITEMPSELHGVDVALIAGAAFLLTLAATIYPARRAAATEPAEALRYE